MKKIALLMLIFVFLFNIKSIQAFNEWEVVGTAGFSAGNATYISTALDKNNVPYIFYQDQYNGQRGTVKKFNGSSWETVGTEGFTLQTGLMYWGKIAFDTNNVPYVGYSEYGLSSKMEVRKFNGTNWVNVGTAGFTASSAIYDDFYISKDNKLYVAFQDGANSAKLTVMTFNGTSWVVLGSAGISSGNVAFIRLAANSSNQIHVSYYDGGNSKIVIKKYNGTSWETVGTELSYGSHSTSDFVFDENDKPVIIYTEPITNKIIVKKLNNSTWENVGETGFSSEYSYEPNIIRDSTNVLSILYKEGFSQNFKYTVRRLKNGLWLPLDTANLTSQYSSYASLQADKNNFIYLAYSDGDQFGKSTVKKFIPISAPELTTDSLKNKTQNSVKVYSTVNSDNGSTITERGVVYNTSTDPTTLNSKTTTTGTTGSFDIDLTGLQSGTKYFIRSFATNEVGTSYGENLNFWTLSTEPTSHPAFTGSPNNNTSINLTFSKISTLTNIKGYLILIKPGTSKPSTEGIIDAISPNDLILPNGTTLLTNLTNNEIDSYLIEDLSQNEDYSFIIIPYNWNSNSTETYNYKTEDAISISTFTGVPITTTGVVANIQHNSAAVNLSNTSYSTANVVERGVVYNTTINPTINDSKVLGTGVSGDFDVTLTNLNAGVKYYSRAFTTYNFGTSYGENIEFWTLADLPSHSSSISISEKGATSAKLNFQNLFDNGNADGYITIIRSDNNYNTEGIINGKKFNSDNLTNGNELIADVKKSKLTYLKLEDLEPETSYFVSIIPYNKSNNDSTINYNTTNYKTINFSTLALNEDNFRKISLQGVLENAACEKVADGTYEVKFSIYSTTTDSTALWTETHTLNTKNGIFNVLLGSISPIDIGFDTSYYLGIKVGTDNEMSPRTPIVGAIYKNGGFGR